MKTFKQLINEDKHDIEVYHYSNHKFNSFDSSKLVGGNDQKGPGLYTSSEHENSYGQHLHRIQLNTKKFIKPGQKVNKKIITDLIDRSPHKETAFSNWHENPREGRHMLINHIVKHSDDMHEAMEKVWYDGYNADNHAFIENAKDHFHGTIVKSDIFRPIAATHYIIWHKDAIKSIKHE